MAAYKRSATVKVRKRSHKPSATPQTESELSLSILLRSKAIETQKFTRTKNNFYKPYLHHWTVFLYNSSANSPLEAANSSAIAEERLRRRKKEDWKDLNRWRRRRRNYQFIFGFKPRNQQTESKFKGSWRFWFESPIKTQVNTWTYFFLAHEHQQVQIDVDPWKFKELCSKTMKP